MNDVYLHNSAVACQILVELFVAALAAAAVAAGWSHNVANNLRHEKKTHFAAT